MLASVCQIEAVAGFCSTVSIIIVLFFGGFIIPRRKDHPNFYSQISKGVNWMVHWPRDCVCLYIYNVQLDRFFTSLVALGFLAFSSVICWDRSVCDRISCSTLGKGQSEAKILLPCCGPFSQETLKTNQYPIVGYNSFVSPLEDHSL